MFLKHASQVLIFSIKFFARAIITLRSTHALIISIVMHCENRAYIRWLHIEIYYCAKILNPVNDNWIKTIIIDDNCIHNFKVRGDLEALGEACGRRARDEEGERAASEVEPFRRTEMHTDRRTAGN